MSAEIGSPPTNTVRLAHQVRGSGRPIMLVTGTGYAGTTWPEAFIAPLAERHTVITFDHRGTGASPSTPGPYSTRLFAADAAALLQELHLGPVALVGHSMGGRVAQWMALDAPAEIDRLVLVASGPGQYRDDEPQTNGLPLAPVLGMIEKGFAAYLRSHIKHTFFTPEFAEAHRENVSWLVDAFLAGTSSLENYLKHVIARQQHRTTDLLPCITAPTLVLVGDQDTHQGGTGTHWDQAFYLAEHLPDATLTILKGCAHGYFWQEPEITLRALLAWLD